MDTTSVLDLMLPAFCECLVLVGIHAYLGIHVIKRKVIFVDLAFAQIAALGTLVAFLFGIPPHTVASFGFAFSLTVLGAAVFALCRFRNGKIPQEAVIGLVYAIAAAVSILLIDKAPHGAEHLKEILTGSILWVRWESVLLAAVVYAVVGLFHFAARKRFFQISEDPEAAWDAGVNVRLWDFLFYVSFGLVITLSVDVAGVLIVFVFLVAPAILAMSFSDRLPVQLAVGWGLGVLVTVIGLVLAYVLDLPTGPAVIATYGLTTLLFAGGLYVVRARPRRAAVRNALAVAAAFAIAAGLLALAGSRLRDPDPGHSAPTNSPVEIEGDLELAERVLRALEADASLGATLAVDFLRGDRPPFPRALVVEKIVELMGENPGFVLEEESGSPANRRALDRVRGHFGLTEAGDR